MLSKNLRRSGRCAPLLPCGEPSCRLLLRSKSSKSFRCRFLFLKLSTRCDLRRYCSPSGGAQVAASPWPATRRRPCRRGRWRTSSLRAACQRPRRAPSLSARARYQRTSRLATGRRPGARRTWVRPRRHARRPFASPTRPTGSCSSRGRPTSPRHSTSWLPSTSSASATTPKCCCWAWRTCTARSMPR